MQPVAVKALRRGEVKVRLLHCNRAMNPTFKPAA